MGLRTSKYVVLSLTLLLISLFLVSPATAEGAHSPAGPSSTTIDHLVTDIVFNYSSPSVLLANQNLTFTFNYTTNQLEGVRIFGRPMANGSLAPNYAAHGSPLYPVGSGSGTGFVTITSGSAVVDGIRLQMWNADQSALLYETVLPVTYSFSDQPNAVNAVSLNPATPNILGTNQNVDFPFQYASNHAGGVRIFGRPFSGGSLSLNYAAHGSPLYPTGSGAGSGFFTVTSGEVVVDGLRFQLWDDAQTSLLFENILPVHYVYTGEANRVTNVALSLASPNVLLYNENLNLTFNYTTNDPGGVRIFVRPMSNGALTASYAAHGSPLYPSSSGVGSGFFAITAGPERVDAIRIQMVNADQSILLFEAVLPVHYLFGPYVQETASLTRVYIPFIGRD